jgi:hypothetical protein
MVNRPPRPNRYRDETIKIMATRAEKRELLKAAVAAGAPLSVWLRERGLEAARREKDRR